MTSTFPQGREALRAGLPWLYVVGTSSMSPAIPAGATVLVRPCTAGELVRGDIVCLDERPRPLVHRFVGLRYHRLETEVITRGDRNPFPDLPAVADSVLGRVVRVWWGPLEVPLDHPVVGVLVRGFSAAWPLIAPPRPIRSLLRARLGAGPQA